MTYQGWVEIGLLLSISFIVAWPLGLYLVRMCGDPHYLVPNAKPALAPLKSLLLKLAGSAAQREQSWGDYCKSLLCFSAVSTILLFAILRLQHWLPLNPQALPPMDTALALNTAISFASNVDWQSYSGETALSMFSQMVGLGGQMFLSAAVSLAVAMAFIRGFAREKSKTIGNFYQDLVRGTVYVLLPGAFILAVLLLWQGSPQSFDAPAALTTMEGATQTILLGPVASHTAIEVFGTNGGGYFNANLAHPFANPTPLSNVFLLIAVLALPLAVFVAFGLWLRRSQEAVSLLLVMALLFSVSLIANYWSEAQSLPGLMANSNIEGSNTLRADIEVGNMEGKEQRFSIASASLFQTAATLTAIGASNSSLGGSTSLGALSFMVNLTYGGPIFGGLGSGLYSMLLYVLLAVFIAGLMVGRTPEYLGKKIEAHEIKLVMLALLVVPVATLLLAVIYILCADTAYLPSASPEVVLGRVLYAFTSAVANNGSAMPGMDTSNALFNNLMALGIAVGRFMVIVPVLALSGALAAKQIHPPSVGSFPTATPLFIVLLLAVVLIAGALTFMPVLALGSIVEHLNTLMVQP